MIHRTAVINTNSKTGILWKRLYIPSSIPALSRKKYFCYKYEEAKQHNDEWRESPAIKSLLAGLAEKKNRILFKRYNCIYNRSISMFQSENLSLVFIDLSQSFYLLHWIKNSFQFIQSSSFP